MAGGEPLAASKTPALDLFVASELYASGGHTALLGDYLRSVEGGRRLLAVTNLSNAAVKLPPGISRRLGIEQRETVICPLPDLAGKCRWLMRLLAEQRPQRVFLFTHPHDSAAIAACQPGWGARYHFIHHSDRSPSLGAVCSDFAHVDLTPFCFACCRQAGIDNLYLPLVVEDLGAREPSQFDHGSAGMRTAACGSAGKFELERSDLYGRAVAAILTTTGGQHLHIGDLSRTEVRRLRAMLRRNGADPGQLVHIPFVPSLWRALGEHRVDLYIGSLPQRGARASVEAMGSATPALWHLSAEAHALHDTHMKYPEAAFWRDTDDLARIVRRIDAPWLRGQSAAARHHYERFHHPRLLRQQLAGERIEGLAPHRPGQPAGEPRPMDFDALRISRGDALRTYLVLGRSRWRGRLQRSPVFCRPA
jgi:hypothetical protein